MGRGQLAMLVFGTPSGVVTVTGGAWPGQIKGLHLHLPKRSVPPHGNSEWPTARSKPRYIAIGRHLASLATEHVADHEARHTVGQEVGPLRQNDRPRPSARDVPESARGRWSSARGSNDASTARARPAPVYRAAKTLRDRPVAVTRNTALRNDPGVPKPRLQRPHGAGLTRPTRVGSPPAWRRRQPRARAGLPRRAILPTQARARARSTRRGQDGEPQPALCSRWLAAGHPEEGW